MANAWEKFKQRREEQRAEAAANGAAAWENVKKSMVRPAKTVTQNKTEETGKVSSGVQAPAEEKTYWWQKKPEGAWAKILDALGMVGHGGDSTQPLNDATVAINEIRRNPEQVKDLVENRAEIEAKQQTQAERTKQWADEHPVLASAASVVSSPLSMTDYLQELVEINAVGHSLPHEDQLPGQITQTLREGASEDMGGVGKFLYNTAMSGVDSFAAAAMGGGVPGVGGLILGGGAASSAMNDIKARGGTDRQAIVGGIASGIFEGLFEQLSIGQLDALKELPVDGAKTLLKNLVKATVTNASEEGATEIANILFDTAFMGELSSYALMVKEAMAQGKTEEEAKRSAILDFVGQVGQSMASGALMGVGMGGVGSAAGYLNHRTGQNAAPKENTTLESGAADGPTVTGRPGQESPGAVTEGTGMPGEIVAGNAVKTAPVATVGVHDLRGVDGRLQLRSLIGDEELKYLDKLSRAADVPINVVEARQDGVQGWYENGQIYIAENAEDPFGEVAKHELTHHLQRTAPAEYGKYRELAGRIMTEKYGAEGVEKLIADLQEKHAGHGLELSREDALDELAADFTQQLLVDEDMFRRVARENRNLAQRLLDSLREFLRKVRDTLTHRQLTELEQAEQLWEAALRESVQGSTVPDTAAGTKYSFAGQRARTADQEALREAETMEAAGSTNEEMRQATGWFRGADGKWRFEIDDSGMEYRSGGDALMRQNNERYAEFRELELRWLQDYGTERWSAEDQNRFDYLRKIYGNEPRRLRERVTAGNAALEDILQHDELFQAYPELRNVRVRFAELDEGARGTYNRRTNTIVLADTLRQAPQKTILHEVQHVIQEIEGFSGGASPKYWEDVLLGGEEIRSKGYEEAMAALQRFVRDPENAEITQLDRQLDNAETDEDYDAIYVAAERRGLTERLAEYRDLMWEAESQRGRPGRSVPSELYRNTAGEIEARDAAGRRDLTAEQRRETAPDTGGGNTVFAESNRAEDYIAGRISDEDVERGIRAVTAMEPVKEISGDEFAKGEKDLVTQVTEFFDELGNRVYNPQLGDVILDRKGVKDDLGHGIGRKKAAAFAAVPEVLERGKVIDYQENWKGRGYDTAVVAAPVVIGGEQYLEGIVLTRGDETNRFYVHEVLTVENNNGALPFKTGTSSKRGLPSGDAPSVISLLQKVRDVKSGSTFREEVNADKQYSIQGTRELQQQMADLQKQNQRLEERNRRLKEQMKRSSRVTTDETEVKRTAAQLLKDLSSRYDKAELGSRLQRLYDSMADPGQAESMSQTEIHREARNIAEAVLGEVSVLNDDLYQEYSDLRKYLRTTKINVPQSLWGELEIAGGYNEFRRRNMGRLNLSSTEGRGVEDVYQELSYDYPGLFDQDAVSHPGDQLLQLAEVLDSLKPVYENPYAADRRNVADWLAGEIMERFYDLPQTAPTFADRAAAKVDAARQEERRAAKERFQKALADQEKRHQRKLERIRESNRQANARIRENMTATKLRDTIKRHAEGLSRKLLRPTDKQHIPEGLRGSVLALLEVVDLESKYGYEFTRDATFRRVNRSENPNTEPTKRTTAALALAAEYRALSGDPEFNGTIDPDLADKLEEIAKMGDIRVADMNREQLQTVWETVRAVESSVTKADKMLGESKYQKISAAADQLRADVGDREDRKNLAGILGKGDQLLNLDMLTPETFLHRLGGVGDELHRQMRLAQDKNIGILSEGIDFYKRAAKENGVDLLKAEKENHEFKLPGGTIELTTAQVMDLYGLSKRQQAMEHIYKGGLRARGGRKGIYKVGSSAAVKVNYEDVATILEVLTPEQKAFVDKLQSYMSTQLAAHGNEASMEAYGYEKFKEKNYWPIKVSNTETDSDPAKEARAKTVPGFGMTKALQPHASNSVTLRSALDTYSEHLNQMATYAAWLTASENITKLQNYDFMESGQRTGTVKALFEKVYGEGGGKYLGNLLSDVAQGSKTGSESTFSDAALGRFKAAKVGANLRVILQQPTALLRAAEMLDPKYLGTVGSPKKGWEAAKQWAPIARWKDWGYFEMDTGRSMRELMAGTEKVLDKVKNTAMAGAGLMDNVAWGHLWNAVEAETKDKRSDLKAGTDEYYRHVAERFSEIIDRTQVVDSVLHRTQIMRSGNAFNRLSTSFMSEPSKVYNMVLRDVYDLIHTEKGSQARKRAVKNMARTGVALVASFAVNSVAQSLVDALRDDDREKGYLEKLGDAYGENFFSNFDPLGYIPYIKDVESIVRGFTVERADLEGIADFVQACETMGKVIAGKSTKTPLNAGMDLALKALDAIGLPGSNIKRDVTALLSTALQAAGADWATYQMDKLLLDIDHSSNAGVFYDTLYRAMSNDWDTYTRIYWDMVASGLDPVKIASAMEKRMAEGMGLGKASALPIDYSAPGKDKSFDQVVQEQLMGGMDWEEILGDRLHLAGEIDALAPEDGESSVTDAQRRREIADSIFGESVKEVAMERWMSESAYERYMAARGAGVSTYEYINLLEDIEAATLERRGKKGSASQADVLTALQKSGLTVAQKRAVWYSYGYKSESPWG